MKRLRFLLRGFISVLLVAVFAGGLDLSAVNVSSGQEIRAHSVRGMHPPVDIQSVSTDAMEQGVFLLKFSNEAMRQIEEKAFEKGVVTIDSIPVFSRDDEGVLKTGLTAFDSLSERYHLYEVRQVLDMLYEGSPASHAYRNRHREWGFHLWYEFRTATKTDIASVVSEYNSISEIEFAEPVYKIRAIGPVEIEKESLISDKAEPGSDAAWTPNDPNYDIRQWHFNNTGQEIGGIVGLEGADISMPEAWGISKGNPSVIVAVIDGGVQINHPDIAANMWAGIGYNFVDGNSTITPDNHGTHVAGTIAAVSNNGTGVAGIAGGDGNGNGVQIMTCQIFKGSNSGGIAQAMIYAADNGAAISQNSWGYKDPNVYSQLGLDAIDYFNTNGGGGVMDGGISIFAAGNSNSEEPRYPAYYSGAFAVASTDNIDKKSGFSNYGSWIDVSAPGSSVYSTVASSGYGALSGTSMACPHVTGVVALILSMAPGAFTAQQIADIIKSSTDNHYDYNPDYVGKLGSGRLNAHAALQKAITMLDDVQNPYSFQASSSGASQIMIAWNENLLNQPVMIAWSANGAFGSPVDGVSYSAGQPIPGGGTVLYKGANTIYSHSGLIPNTQYHYRAWSYNNDSEYSSGVTSSAKTDCLTEILPLTESFAGGQIPLPCWSVLDNDGDGKNWFIGGAAYSPHNGSYVAVSESYLLGHGPLEPDNWLISPRFSVSSDFLKIRYWRKAYDADYAQETYSVLVSKTGKEPSDFIEYFQETLSDDQWRERVLMIPDMSGKQAYVAFRHYGSTDQSRLLLDNISLEEEMAPVSYVITATSGTGGSISPSGMVVVYEGQSQSFFINANSGYEIEDVIVDGSSLGPQSSYTFSDIQSDHSISAVFTLKAYTITASAGTGGSITPSGTVLVSHGQDQSFSINANSGYEIENVIVNGTSLGPQTSYTFSNVQSNHTISAVFSTNGFTITASAGTGGSISPSGAVLVTPGQSQSFSINANIGYEIQDVIVDGSSLGPQTSYAFINVQSDHSISAVFSPKSYTITASSGTGGSISPSGTLEVSHGQSQSFTISPAGGYYVSSVYVDGVSYGPLTSYTFTNIQSDHSIYAVFVSTTHTISTYAGTGGSISPSGIITVSHGQNQVFSITPNTGYHITMVFIDGQNIGPQTSYSFTNVTKNHFIEAYFAINSYTITSTAGAGGAITPAGSLVLEHGADQSYAITADEGFHISDVLVDDVSQGPVDGWVFESVSADHSIEALFAINTYTITATAGAGGTISPTGALILEHGSAQSYAITADEGFHILDVLVDGASRGPADEWVFESVSADHSIEALFAINTYTITATAGAGGTISPTGALILEHGSAQSYGITADEGFHILDVLVDDVSQGSVDAWVFESVSADHSIEAFFAINTYTITAASGAGGTISPTGASVVEYGDSQSFAITADEGFHILDVVVNGLSQGPADEWVFEGVSTSHAIDAFFAINTYTITATAGAGGTISPTGELVVEHGDSQAYAIIADEGYHLTDVVVDGLSQGAIDTWVFEGISTDHAIHVVFERLYIVTFYVDMLYAEDFSPETDNLFLYGSMFDWNETGELIEDKASLQGENHWGYVYKTELPAGSYEYMYYLNTFPAGSEWSEAPYRTFTVPDTLEVFDFFGYRTDPTQVPLIAGKGMVNIYPNPARGNITVESNLIIDGLWVYDINGRLMRYAEPGMSRHDLNIAGWPDGVYFIRAEAEGSIFTRTVVVRN